MRTPTTTNLFVATRDQSDWRASEADSRSDCGAVASDSTSCCVTLPSASADDGVADGADIPFSDGGGPSPVHEKRSSSSGKSPCLMRRSDPVLDTCRSPDASISLEKPSLPIVASAFSFTSSGYFSFSSRSISMIRAWRSSSVSSSFRAASIRSIFSARRRASSLTSTYLSPETVPVISVTPASSSGLKEDLSTMPSFSISSGARPAIVVSNIFGPLSMGSGEDVEHARAPCTALAITRTGFDTTDPTALPAAPIPRPTSLTASAVLFTVLFTAIDVAVTPATRPSNTAVVAFPMTLLEEFRRLKVSPSVFSSSLSSSSGGGGWSCIRRRIGDANRCWASEMRDSRLSSISYRGTATPIWAYKSSWHIDLSHTNSASRDSDISIGPRTSKSGGAVTGGAEGRSSCGKSSSSSLCNLATVVASRLVCNAVAPAGGFDAPAEPSSN
eukprot:m.456160 g.456160  ORF g.456160 m.456160 type:complete len:444 (+) comp21000_c0_seq1:117-1448(+)